MGLYSYISQEIKQIFSEPLEEREGKQGPESEDFKLNNCGIW
jgi:hypothetical protein